MKTTRKIKMTLKRRRLYGLTVCLCVVYSHFKRTSHENKDWSNNWPITSDSVTVLILNLVGNFVNKTSRVKDNSCLQVCV